MVGRIVVATAVAVCVLSSLGAAQSYSVAVIGDMPYVRNEGDAEIYLPRYHRLLAKLDSADVAAVVHLGDYTNGPLCGDSIVNQRFAEFSRSAHPFIFIFGDNDWTDCGRGGFQPLERLAKLRAVFAQGETSLGRSTLPLTRQLPNFPENVRWTMGNELYIALNLPGSDNNWGKDEAPQAEFVERNQANLAWLRESFEIAQREGRRGVAVFIQANPGLEGPPWIRRTENTRGFRDFNNELQALAQSFGKPVLLVHGDSHYFRIDKPYVNAAQRVITNLTRVEGFAHPNYHWVRLKVEANDANVFTIIPEIVAEHTP